MSWIVDGDPKDPIENYDAFMSDGTRISQDIIRANLKQDEQEIPWAKEGEWLQFEKIYLTEGRYIKHRRTAEKVDLVAIRIIIMHSTEISSSRLQPKRYMELRVEEKLIIS